MDCIEPYTCMAGEMQEYHGGEDTQRVLERLANQLQFYKPPRINEVDQNKHYSCTNYCKERRAAVLVCIFEGHQGDLRVILTKRTMKLASHPGDVALPGGKMEEGDADDCATALRESMEEIGLDPTLVQVVAIMEPFLSQHLLRVVPVVGLLSRIQDFKPVLNTDEVDAVFDAPLEMFLKGENHRSAEGEWMNLKYAIHLFDFESEKGIFVVCGLTASILIRAASIIYQQPPSFQEHYLPDFQQLQSALNNAAEA